MQKTVKPPWLSQEEEQEIINTICWAEKQSSGEIRVYLESSCKKKNPLDRAVQVFYQLKMDETEQRNGILIYISVDDRQLAVIGDQGINQFVQGAFWEQLRSEITTTIQSAGLCAGIIKGIKLCTVSLSKYFPYKQGDINELPNEISFAE